MIFLAKSLDDRDLIDEIALVISHDSEKSLSVSSEKSASFRLLAMSVK